MSQASNDQELRSTSGTTTPSDDQAPQTPWITDEEIAADPIAAALKIALNLNNILFSVAQNLTTIAQAQVALAQQGEAMLRGMPQMPGIPGLTVPGSGR